MGVQSVYYDRSTSNRLLVGGHEVVAHRISVGDFAAFNVYMVQLIWPMIAIGWVVNLFQRGTASVVRCGNATGHCRLVLG